MLPSTHSSFLSLTAGIALAAGMLHGAEAAKDAPVIWFFLPQSGAPGSSVLIQGQNLGGANGVAFGGVQAVFSPLGRGMIRATVPAGAVTGPITVRTPSGTGKSYSAFTVIGTSAPTLTALSPGQGPVGTVVTLTGTGFTTAATVSFNGKAALVTFVSATQIKATVPAGATSGRVSVSTSLGTATSSTAFTVTAAGAPTLTALSPGQGPVGTVVTLTGTGFTTAATVSFNGKAALVTFVSATQLKATVPAGATSGPVSVTTSLGTATSSTSFVVQTAPGTLDLSIGGWYINQSVQTLARSVPLVAGKNGYLRVFPVASATNAVVPKVKVTVTGGSPSPWVQTISAPDTSVPTALSEGTLASSWNLSIPGAVLAVGSSLTLELNPDGAVPESNKNNNTLTSALTLQKLPPFATTIIPVTQQGLTGNVNAGGRTLASWVAMLHTMYPVGDAPGDMDVALGTPYTTQANLNDTSGAGWSTLLGEIENKRVAEAKGRNYFAAVHVNYSSGLAGLGYIGAPSAVGWDNSGYGEVFAHETGHNLNRKHAPCGNPSGVDSNWPTDAAHASAQIGVYGYDTSAGVFMGPTAFKDVMSYCSPNWVSDYTYSGIFTWRAASHLNGSALEESPAPEAPPAKIDCLLVSGHVRSGQLALNPAYVVYTRPELPKPGDYTLELKDHHGLTLLTVPFGTTEIGDASPVPQRDFTFAIPLTCELETAYQAIRVITPEGGLLSRSAGPGEVHQRPTATPWGPGKVRVQWDSKAFPTAMIRDSGSHEVLAFAQGGLLDLATEAKVLEITLSDGVRSKRIKVETGNP